MAACYNHLIRVGEGIHKLDVHHMRHPDAAAHLRQKISLFQVATGAVGACILADCLIWQINRYNHSRSEIILLEHYPELRCSWKQPFEKDSQRLDTRNRKEPAWNELSMRLSVFNLQMLKAHHFNNGVKGPVFVPTGGYIISF